MGSVLWTVTLLGGLTFPNMVEIDCHPFVSPTPAQIELWEVEDAALKKQAEKDTDLVVTVTPWPVAYQVFRRPRHGEFCLDGALLRAGYEGKVYTSGAFTLMRPAIKADDWATP